jgi:hypothetical protein
MARRTLKGSFNFKTRENQIYQNMCDGAYFPEEYMHLIGR